MAKLLCRLKAVNHRYFVVAAFFAGLIAWSVLVCRDSYIRLYESFRDLGTSFLDLIFYGESWCPAPTVNELSSVKVQLHLPQTWVDISQNFDVFFELFFDSQHFFNYLTWIVPLIQIVNQLLCFSLIFILGFFVFKKLVKPPVENDVDLVSVPLKLHFNFRRYIYLPVGNYIRSVLVFFFEIKSKEGDNHRNNVGA